LTKTVAIVQARTSSSRLPGKVLMPVCGIPMVVFLLRRVARAKRVDEVMVATSVDPSDDDLVDVVERAGFGCYRGDLNDVLNRFYGAAQEVGGEIIVRITGDCPLVDADLIDTVVHVLEAEKSDYVSNVDPPSYPDGLDVEAFTFSSLRSAWSEARLISEREHVTPYIRRRRDLFKQLNVSSSIDLSSLRWTVDYQDDFEFISSMLARIASQEPLMADRFDFLRVLEKHPELLSLNHHKRNEGYAISVAQDQGAIK